MSRLESRCRSLALPCCIALLLVLTAACTRDTLQAVERQQLQEIPYPKLESLEDLVRQQLEKKRGEVEAALAAPRASRKQLSEVFGRAGMLYHAYELWFAAEACYRNARQLDPADLRWPYYLGHLYRAEGEFERSAQSFHEALELQTDHVPSLFHLAEVERDQGRHDEAERLLERALGREPDCARCLIGLGQVASARRDFAAAVLHFEQALKLAPQATEVYYPLALAFRHLGQQEKAETLIRQRGRKSPAFEDPLMLELESLAGGWRIQLERGAGYFKEGLHDRALAKFRLAAAAAPQEALVHANLGSVLVQLANYEEAQREYEEALRLDPHMALAHFNLGTLSARLGDDGKAVEHYREALRIDPRMVDAHLNLGNALRRSQRFDEAADHYREVVEQEPSNVQARLAEALTLVRLRRYGEAAERLEQAHLALPEEAQITSALVRLLAAAPVEGLRDGGRALSMARALLAQESSLPHVVGLAMAAAENGQFELALEWQAKAIAAVQAAHRPKLLSELQENYQRYQQREPCRQPWREDDPALSPPRIDPP